MVKTESHELIEKHNHLENGNVNVHRIQSFQDVLHKRRPIRPLRLRESKLMRMIKSLFRPKHRNRPKPTITKHPLIIHPIKESKYVITTPKTTTEPPTTASYYYRYPKTTTTYKPTTTISYYYKYFTSDPPDAVVTEKIKAEDAITTPITESPSTTSKAPKSPPTTTSTTSTTSKSTSTTVTTTSSTATMRSSTVSYYYKYGAPISSTASSTESTSAPTPTTTIASASSTASYYYKYGAPISSTASSTESTSAPTPTTTIASASSTVSYYYKYGAPISSTAASTESPSAPISTTTAAAVSSTASYYYKYLSPVSSNSVSAVTTQVSTPEEIDTSTIASSLSTEPYYYKDFSPEQISTLAPLSVSKNRYLPSHHYNYGSHPSRYNAIISPTYEANYVQDDSNADDSIIEQMSDEIQALKIEVDRLKSDSASNGNDDIDPEIIYKMQADINSLSSDIDQLKRIYHQPVFQNSQQIGYSTLANIPNEINYLRKRAQRLGSNTNNNYPVVYYSNSPVQPFIEPDEYESTKYYTSDDNFRHSKIKSLAPPTHGLTVVGP